jgi:hypothetical protein
MVLGIASFVQIFIEESQHVKPIWNKRKMRWGRLMGNGIVNVAMEQ